MTEGPVLSGELQAPGDRPPTSQVVYRESTKIFNSIFASCLTNFWATDS